mmetsp:Transcript_61817/g.177926  ORF Transcript_61817/g.177926 Transcript_61817/m.177926 type:complete len:257 (+) Transcript_61817:49-819(+)
MGLTAATRLVAVVAASVAAVALQGCGGGALAASERQVDCGELQADAEGTKWKCNKEEGRASEEDGACTEVVKAIFEQCMDEAVSTAQAGSIDLSRIVVDDRREVDRLVEQGWVLLPREEGSSQEGWVLVPKPKDSSKPRSQTAGSSSRDDAPTPTPVACPAPGVNKTKLTATARSKFYVSPAARGVLPASIGERLRFSPGRVVHAGSSLHPLPGVSLVLAVSALLGSVAVLRQRWARRSVAREAMTVQLRTAPGGV